MVAPKPDAMNGHNGHQPGIVEIIFITITVVFAAVAVLYLSVARDGASWAPLLLILPATLVIASLITRYSHLVYATVALCFLLGLITIFSIGIPLIVMAICLLGWHGIRSLRVLPGGNRWEGVLAFNIWFFAFLAPLAGYLIVSSWL